MPHKILYSELQPCVLVSCECRKDEPYLMMFRSMTQVIVCGWCQQEYGISLKGHEISAVAIPTKEVRTVAKAN